jgi:hypothetical protein
MAKRGLLGTIRDFFVGELRAPESYPEVLKQLEIRLAQLEADNAERQLAVLAAVEKTLYQLRARESARESKRATAVEAQDDGEVTADAPDRAHSLPSTAHLSRRFRRL